MILNMSRRGTLLIIVAGLSAMLAALSATYLSSIRSRERESDRAYVDAQARILLYAACQFIVDHDGLNVAGVYPFYSWNRSVDALGGAVAAFDPAEGCPTDTWFRVAGTGPDFEVMVGVDLSRGIRGSTAGDYATDTAAIPALVQQAIGIPSLSNVPKFQRQGHRETYRVTWSGGAITTIQRQTVESGAF
jgi:hypothetical protein